MPVPKFLKSYLPSYDLEKLNLRDSDVAREIISQVLNLGDEKAVAWVFENYTLDKIREIVRKPERGVWNEESLNYWRNILKLEGRVNCKSSLINIYPA